MYGGARTKSNIVMEAPAAALEAALVPVVSPLSCWQTLKMLKSFKPTSSGSGKGRQNSEGAKSISFHDNPCLQASSISYGTDLGTSAVARVIEQCCFNSVSDRLT